MADDMGFGELQCLNPTRGKIKTPQLDAIAASGMIFTDAHSGSSVCTPTRYGLMTGRYAWRTHLQEGVSFLAALLSNAADVRSKNGDLHSARYVVIHHSISGYFAIRQDQWKLCVCPDSGGWTDPKPAAKAWAKLE